MAFCPTTRRSTGVATAAEQRVRARPEIDQRRTGTGVHPATLEHGGNLTHRDRPRHREHRGR